MKTRACSVAVAAVVLFLASESVRASGTNVVYAYGGYFDFAIPADPSETRGWMRDAVIFVPHHIIISDLNLLVNIQHTSAFDLKLALRGPSGQVATLAAGEPREGYYQGANYAGTQFDDEADVAVEDASPPFAGSVRPKETLAVFDGRDSYGAWTLLVCDTRYGDVGRLESIVLTITGAPKSDGVAVPAPAAMSLAILGATVVELRRRRTAGPRSRA